MPTARGTGILGPPRKPSVANMSTVSKPSRLKVLIYGAPGVGKTWLAGSAPKPLLFDFDGGATSLAGRNVDVVERPTTEEFQGHVSWLLQERGAGYETIIIDTLTAAQKQSTVELMGTQDRMTQQLWGDVLTIWRKLLISLEGLPCNLVVLCHEREENLGDEEHAVKQYSYALQGSIASDVNAMFDSIGRFTKRVATSKVEDGKRVAIKPVELRRISFFAPDESFRCKDRLGLFGQKPLRADVEVLALLAHEGAGQQEDEQAPPDGETSAPPPTPAPEPAPPPKAEPPPKQAPEAAPTPPPAKPQGPPRRRRKAEKPTQQAELPGHQDESPEKTSDSAIPDEADAPPADQDDTTVPPEGDEDFPWDTTEGGTP